MKTILKPTHSIPYLIVLSKFLWDHRVKSFPKDEKDLIAEFLLSNSLRANIASIVDFLGNQTGYKIEELANKI